MIVIKLSKKNPPVGCRVGDSVKWYHPCKPGSNRMEQELFRLLPKTMKKLFSIAHHCVWWNKVESNHLLWIFSPAHKPLLLLFRVDGLAALCE